MMEWKERSEMQREAVAVRSEKRKNGGGVATRRGVAVNGRRRARVG